MNEEIKKEIEDKLQNFAHSNKYETPLNEWKNGFDKIMSEYANNGTLHNYYVKCDDENNIYLDNDIKIVDVYIEPTKGAGIFVNQISIIREGEISKGGL